MKTALGTYTSRKVELSMVAAVVAMRGCRKGNTEVVYATNEATSLPTMRVYLHSNHIADVHYVAGGQWELQVIRDTLKRWPTPTTISRLRALGADITVKRGVVSLDGSEVAYYERHRLYR